MAKSPDPDIVVTTVRLPKEIHEYLNRRAKHYYSSQTAEVVRAVRDQMERDKPTEHALITTLSTAL